MKKVLIQKSTRKYNKWYCPYCSTDEYGYIDKLVRLRGNKEDGYYCPRCKCYTAYPEEDACINIKY